MASAYDQQPLGNRYWTEVEGKCVHGCQTAYVEIDDPPIADRLQRMNFADGVEAAMVVDDYLGIESRCTTNPV